MFRSRRARFVLAVSIALLAPACTTALKHETKPPSEILTSDRRSPYLKAHLKDGRLCVFTDWRLDPAPATERLGRLERARSISTEGVTLLGHGTMFDPSRAVIREGSQSFPLDSVVLVESNVEVERMPTVIKGLLLVAGALVVTLAIVCSIDPKACFGSCPTFYVSDGTHPMLQAEGFSASVMPALEETDVDALYRARPRGRQVDVTMRNEALETHVVRFVKLLAAPREPGTRVFAAPSGAFWRARDLRTATAARGPEGDCEPELREFDGAERRSLADSTDLAARETLDLMFVEPPAGDLGLVLAARQSLLPTFLFYQSLAWLGSTSGEWMARVERGDPLARAAIEATGRRLGAIEVQVRDRSGAWVTADNLYETGPLATDVHVVPLPAATRRPVEVRLRMACGMWRLDWVALARLESEVRPVPLDPESVLRDGAPDKEARALLADPRQALVTTRGDAYTLRYRLPGDPERYELFLQSRGYYLEWMREEWRAEENPARALRLFTDPAAELRALAPEFKRREAAMEDLFWSSRYANP